MTALLHLYHWLLYRRTWQRLAEVTRTRSQAYTGERLREMLGIGNKLSLRTLVIAGYIERNDEGLYQIIR